MSPAPAEPREPSRGGERIVAVALAAMAAVLLWVWIDLHRRSGREVAPLDLANPLLGAEAGECLEVEDASQPGVGSRLVVIAPGDPAARGRGAAVIRPASGPASIPGYVQVGDPDLRTTAPYLACEVRSSADAPAGAPAAYKDVLLFDLNAFGLTRGPKPSVVLREIRPAVVRWQGKTLRCHQVTIERFDQLAGNWWLYLSSDAPAIGTVARRTLSERLGVVQHSFHPCR